MIDDDVRQEFEKVNARLDRIEQFLPTVATKADLERSATKDDLTGCATKDDVARCATKDDLEATRREFAAVVETLATKADLERFATKDDLNATRRELGALIETRATKQDLEHFPTSEEVQALVRDEGERTRRHFDVVAESLRDEIHLALEGNMAVTSRIDSLEQSHDRLESRVTTLEAGRSRRKR